MQYESLFAHIERNLYDVLEPGSKDVLDACKAIVSNFRKNEITTDRMVAQLHAVLNGACVTLVENLRDMGYNMEGLKPQGGRARSFQYLNSVVTLFPMLSRYDLGAFFGCMLPTMIDLSTGCDPTFYESVFEDTTGLEVLKLPSSFGRVPTRFLANSTIRRVHAPAVAMVGAYAFFNCKMLKEIEFSQLNGVDDYAFFSCEQLAVDSNFFSVLSFIGTRAFSGSGIQRVDLLCPHFIGDYAFSSMGKLESITAAVSTVPRSFASNCKSLVSVSLPFARSVYSEAFASNPKLKALIMPSNVILYTRAFYETGLESINLSGAEFEGSSHFECCYNLKRIIFSSSMIKIPDRFCYGCADLQSLVTDIDGQPRNRVIHSSGKLGSFVRNTASPKKFNFIDDFDCVIEAAPSDCVMAPKLLTVGQNAFEWCKKLKEVNLWNTHHVKVNAFKNSGIESVITRARLESGAFSSCKELEAVNLPSQLKVPSRAFHNCSKLSWLQMSATDIGPYAFAGCKDLSINFASKAPCFIGPYAFQHCIIDKVVLGDGSRIASYAFHRTGNASKYGKVCIGAGSRIIQRAFQESKLQRLSLGGDVSVAAYGFNKCPDLHTVLADTNLISQGAFSSCTKLTSFIVTRPFQLKTKRPFHWRFKSSPQIAHEVFPKTYPRFSLLSPSCIMKCWSLGTNKHERDRVRLFFYCLAKTPKLALCQLPMELNLELLYSYFVLERI